jgi:hypothetical protein
MIALHQTTKASLLCRMVESACDIVRFRTSGGEPGGLVQCAGELSFLKENQIGAGNRSLTLDYCVRAAAIESAKREDWP